MDKKLIISKTTEFITQKMSGESTGHDWWHVDRVRKVALYIGKKERADLFIVELTALLHDISDWKFSGGDDTAGQKQSRIWLESLSVSEEVIREVCYIIEHLSYKGGTNKITLKSIEGQVVQDADRLDALGAIGIGRTFAYGGFKGRPMYDPALKPQTFKSFEDYKSAKNTTINHFYEKLLLLKDKMNTKTGKKLAEKRHQFMEDFLKEFYDEWAGRVEEA